MTWFVVETECKGERHWHYVFARTSKGAASEAREREFQSHTGQPVVTVVSVETHKPTHAVA